MAGEREQNRDITLPPESYLYLVNEGKGGLLTVHRGPTVVNQTGQDQPVRYESATRTYKQCSLEQAVMNCPRANEGDYVVLENPAENKKFPTESTQQAVQLSRGRKVIIPGPWSEALWPGQMATVVEGHRLRSNQWLMAIVYNADEAQDNWETGTVAVSQTEGDNDEKIKQASQSHKTKGLPKPESFAVGTRIVVKGSDVSFFIPATGCEVLRDKDNKYVREAVTLEQLEYCCLVDESGKKEYPRGPAVVFPKPTQVFEEDKKGRRKFRPIELNTINGIHLKVTADFEDDDLEQASGPDGKRPKRNYQEGTELFVTGKTMSIYYPREELAIIEYGQGNRKHYSTAIPKGEGRYVINREGGEIGLIKGPKMLLPDPRSEILVRRILSEDECRLWYPGNESAILYNRELAQAMAESPSGRSGVVSEGDWRKRQAKMGLVGSPQNIGGRRGLESLQVAAAFSGPEEYEPDLEEAGDAGGAASTIGRGTRYTQPRSLTLNTKFDGVPRVEVWPGYAVLIVGAEGNRRVEQGPVVVLMEYDEKLGFMELSTGKPKSTDKLFKTSYLCVQNNQVGDEVKFESKDHVKGAIKISLRVNFEAQTEEERLRWFSVGNYVKFLTDHVRSIIAGIAKKKSVAEIKDDYVNLIRDAILGPKPSMDGHSQPLRSNRLGLYFESNGMRVVEVEVLDLTLADSNISTLLNNAQHKVVKTNIEIDEARKDLEATKEKERIEQERAEAMAATVKRKRELEKEAAEEEIDLLLAKVNVELKKLDGEKQKAESRELITDFTEEKKLGRAKAEKEYLLEIDRESLKIRKDELDAMTNAAVKRFAAAKDGLYEVLVSLGRDEMATKLAEACTIERFLSGDSVSSSIANLLSISPVLKGFWDKATTLQTEGAGARNRLKSPEVVPTK